MTDTGKPSLNTQIARNEANRFVRHKSAFPSRAKAVAPTWEEFKSKSFTEYVRSVIFADDDEDEEEEKTRNVNKKETTPKGDKTQQPDVVPSTPPQTKAPNTQEEFRGWNRGMLKVTLPKGWWDQSGIANDKTGRGPAWQRGTKLGDMKVRGPIRQKLAGIGGIYEYALFDLPEMTVAEFRDRADAYRTEQVGRAVDSLEEDDDDACDEMARKFWKRLGPTMQPSIYGADMEGSLFDGAEASGWSLQNLDNCLQLLAAETTDCDHLPGVTTPYLYVGMWASVFCAHTEDMNLLSINYLHAGAPKYWYAIAPGDAKRFESLAEFHFCHAKRECPEFLRHKLCLLSPTVLKKAGVPFEVQVQRPGDAIITCAGAYHFGVNLGFNLAEATNFAIPEWIPKGREARVCMCRPHSVRIDMERFEALLERYETDARGAVRLGLPKPTFRQWARMEQNRTTSRRKKQTTTPQQQPPILVVPIDEQPSSRQKPKMRTVMITATHHIVNTEKEFWVEVMKPLAEKTPPKRKKKKDDTGEEWRLAKPLAAKSVCLDLPVLCLLPSRMGDSEDEDDQCFAGIVTEIADGHARIHFAGLSKKEDVWMPLDSPKMFLDGGEYVDPSIQTKKQKGSRR